SGSSNLSPSGEAGNGDNLVMVEDPRVATSYAIEALRVFDHLHFRTVMSDAFAGAAKGGAAGAKAARGKPVRVKAARKTAKVKAAKKARTTTAAAPSPHTATRPSKATAMTALTLKKPSAISGQPAWFTDFYKAGTPAGTRS